MLSLRTFVLGLWRSGRRARLSPALPPRPSTCPPESISTSRAGGLFTGVLDGLIGVGIFSLTMPTMKVAVRDLDPLFVGVGRVLLAVIPSAITLVLLKSRLPNRREFLWLLTVAGCLVFGFSGLVAEALAQVASFHAAIVAGSIPLVVALVATIRERHRQPVRFWIAALVGAFIVVGYGLAKSSWRFASADLLLIGAALLGGIGYAEGGRLGKQLGALAVSCWVPVVAAPFALMVCASRMPESWSEVPLSAWLALAYNGLFSCWLGFIFWYRGLGQGGIARIGQLQLLQPFFTLASVALLFRESLNLVDWIAAGAVAGCVAAAQANSRFR